MSETRSDAAQHEWTADEIRRVGYRTVDLIAQHLTRVPDGPVFQPVPPALAADFRESTAPRMGRRPDDILEDFARDVEPYPFGNGHPRFYAWVNSPPAVIGIFADALAAAMNPSVAGGNHAAVHVERQVVNWLKEIVDFPRDSMGLLVSGGSMAALTALAVARFVAARRVGWDIRANGIQHVHPTFVVYKGAEGHGCNQKAVELLGLGSANLRIVESDGGLRIVPEALDTSIREDLARGHVPVAVVASAGTVNTGAIDPLDAIADVCSRHRVWLHVDGAYGAPASLSGKYRDELRAMRRADSIAIDPHKWLYVPVEAGVVLIKDAQAMRDAFSLVPPYLRTDGDEHGVHGPPWLSEYGIQQTRGFRALKVWMTLKYYGLEGYRRFIDHDLALAEYLARLIREASDFQCWEPQSLSIVCFRYAPRALGGDELRLDSLNKTVLTELQLGGGAFLSSTIVGGRFWLRACIVNHRARQADIDVLVRLVREIGARHVQHLADQATQ
jgi:aromatic-L-amino-acid/L-tryptophan decarboxylase